MSWNWNCTAYFLDARIARALLLTERAIVVCVYAAHAYSFNSIINQIIILIINCLYSDLFLAKFYESASRFYASSLDFKLWLPKA